MIKRYSELILLPTFEERIQYLQLNGTVGNRTFGSYRYINQKLYHSNEWKNFRNRVILRDNGCDLGLPGFDIMDTIIIHHINPISVEDIINRNECIFDLDNVITVSLNTHNAIHYSTYQISVIDFQERKANDTCPWKGGTIG